MKTRSIGSSRSYPRPSILNCAESERIELAPNKYDALRGADALAVVTDWHEYRHPDFEQIKSLLKTSVIVDGRNLYSVERMRDAGFRYSSIGRNSIA